MKMHAIAGLVGAICLASMAYAAPPLVLKPAGGQLDSESMPERVNRLEKALNAVIADNEALKSKNAALTTEVQQLSETVQAHEARLDNGESATSAAAGEAKKAGDLAQAVKVLVDFQATHRHDYVVPSLLFEDVVINGKTCSHIYKWTDNTKTTGLPVKK